MQYQQIGQTGFEVSDVVLGTYKAGGHDWGAVNDFDSIETIKYCIDSGMNLVDTATGYGMGRSERLIRYALDDEGAARRGRAWVLTKFYLWQGPDEKLIKSVSREAQAQFLIGSKARLGVDQLDLVLLHRDDEVTPIETAVETLAEFQASGQIKQIGVSNYSLEHLERAQKVASLQNYQPPFSMTETAFRDDGRLDFCRQHDISVGVYSVLGQGLFAPRLKEASEYASWDNRSRSRSGPEFEKARRIHARLQEIADRDGKSVSQLAIAWVLSHPGVTFAIIGASTPQQAEHNLAASGYRISGDVIAECEQIVQEEKVATRNANEGSSATV